MLWRHPHVPCSCTHTAARGGTPMFHSCCVQGGGCLSVCQSRNDQVAQHFLLMCHWQNVSLLKRVHGHVEWSFVTLNGTHGSSLLSIVLMPHHDLTLVIMTPHNHFFNYSQFVLWLFDHTNRMAITFTQVVQEKQLWGNSARTVTPGGHYTRW